MKGFGSSCGACKYLRRRCTRDCVFSPYFSYDEASTHFAAVHKVFGASNVSRLLLHLPLHNRSDAAITITYQALARMHDPIYGCVAYIYVLQQQVASLQREIDDILGNNFMMKNSSCLGVENYCGSVHQSPMMNINNGIEYIVQEGTRKDHIQNSTAHFKNPKKSSSSAFILDAAFLHLGAHPQRRIPLLPSSSSSPPSWSLPARSPPPASVSSPCATLAHRAPPPMKLRHAALLPLRSSVVPPSSSTPLPPRRKHSSGIWMWLC
ncbi:LOB domain-containing protein [Arachis hypogaea]|nr:LOB domain-containing protein [Arachis hypogaea]